MQQQAKNKPRRLGIFEKVRSERVRSEDPVLTPAFDSFLNPSPSPLNSPLNSPSSTGSFHDKMCDAGIRSNVDTGAAGILSNSESGAAGIRSDATGAVLSYKLGKYRLIAPTLQTTEDKNFPEENSPEFSEEDLIEFRLNRWDEFGRLKTRQWGFLNWIKKNNPNHRHAETLKKHVSFKCRCGVKHNKTATVGFLRDKASWFGLNKCGSVWACPICAPAIMKKHEKDIETGLATATRKGYTIIFITQTIPHYRTSKMLDLMQSMDKARKIYNKGGTLSRIKKDMGYMGSIVRLEPTFGDQGIHPHTHTVMFFQKELSTTEIDCFANFLKSKWKDACTEAGLVNNKNSKTFDIFGFDCKSVNNIDKIIQYMTKTAKEQNTGLAMEMTNASDSKAAEECGEGTDVDNDKPKWGRSQWDVMRGFIAGDRADTNLWLTFIAAFSRKSAIRWSAGLKEKLNVEQEDREETGAEIDETDKKDVVKVYEVDQYSNVLKHRLWRPILDAVDTRDLEWLREISREKNIDFVSQHDDFPHIFCPATLQKMEREKIRRQEQKRLREEQQKADRIARARKRYEKAVIKRDEDYVLGLLDPTMAAQVRADRQAAVLAKKIARREAQKIKREQARAGS